MYLEVNKMILYKEILSKILEKEEIFIAFPNLEINATEIIELKCYSALQKIKTIMEDDSLEDKECFMQIEEVIFVFENLGSDEGTRHDFG